MSPDEVLVEYPNLKDRLVVSWIIAKRHSHFWPKVSKTQSGCWQWNGARTPNGYGKFGTYKLVSAHKFSFEELVGEVAEGLVLDHLCRNPRCVYPAHLEAVTQAVNSQRGDWHLAPERMLAKTHCPQGHPYDLFNTHFDPKRRSRVCRTCRNKRALDQYYKKRGVLR